MSLGCTHRLNRASRRIVDSTAQRQVSHAARNIRRSGITSMRRSTATTSSSLPPNHRSTSTIDSSCSSSGTGKSKRNVYGCKRGFITFPLNAAGSARFAAEL